MNHNKKSHHSCPIWFQKQRWDVNERNVVFGFVISFRFFFVRKFQNLRFFVHFVSNCGEWSRVLLTFTAIKTLFYLYTITFFICGGCISVRQQNVHEHNKNKWNFVFFVRKNRGFARFKQRLIRFTLGFLKAFRFVRVIMSFVSFTSLFRNRIHAFVDCSVFDRVKF